MNISYLIILVMGLFFYGLVIAMTKSPFSSGDAPPSASAALALYKGPMLGQHLNF